MLPKGKGGQSSKDLISFFFVHTFHPYSTNVLHINQVFVFLQVEPDRRAFLQAEQKKFTGKKIASTPADAQHPAIKTGCIRLHAQQKQLNNTTNPPRSDAVKVSSTSKAQV